MTRPTVLLFDIDGTLVSTGGAGRRAIVRAFDRLYGRPDATSHFRFDGMTDRAIVRRALQTIGAADTDAAIDALLASYLVELVDEVARAPDYAVHRGMLECLDAAERLSHMAIGLGTGNVREGARVKLERADLFRRFAFGGFGSDAEDRAELIRTGALRGAESLGAPLAECRVVVIGDTPKDVAAALAIGASCVGVATGSYSLRELEEAGAVAAFADLGEDGAIDAVLSGA